MSQHQIAVVVGSLLDKRLEQGRFVWQQATSDSDYPISAQLSMRLEEISWGKPQRKRQPRWCVNVDGPA